MAKNKNRHKHKPLPTGMTYANKLARDRMVKEAVEKAAKDDTVKLRSDIRLQQALWLHVVAMAKTFGFGPTRVQRFLNGLADASDEFVGLVEKHGQQYTLEKLRQEAERVSGIPIEYLYEKDVREARKRNEERGVFFSVIEEESV